MRILGILALLFLLGCGSVPVEAPPSPGSISDHAPASPGPISDHAPASPGPISDQTPASPTQRIQLKVDASDFVEWGSGGGIDGRWSGTRVCGDGRVIHQEGRAKPREEHVDAARAASLLQAAVDAGILDLQNHPPTGADMLGRGIQASLDGRKVSVSMDEMTQDPAWERVWTVLQVPSGTSP